HLAGRGLSIADGGRPHPVAFAFVSLLLVASGVLFSHLAGADGSRPDPAVAARKARLVREVAIESARTGAEVQAAARRFFAAYLRYEVGTVNAAVRAAIRRDAEPSFADVLLLHTPRAPRGGAFPPRAVLRGVDVSLQSGERAIVEGSARRGRMPERFSFEFRRIGGAWLASGAGH
ncbi:MAG TPA: hypothetical protein VG518_07295, partial [Solirubrobacterales bacterium]|nr:hypothetical protein [Solirubrobacterales bacterium]